MKQDQVTIERYVPIVAAVGLIGLLTSLYLLSDYSAPLMQLLKGLLSSLH